MSMTETENWKPFEPKLFEKKWLLQKQSVTFGSTGVYFSLFSSGIEFLSFIKVNSSSIDDMRFTFTIRCYFVVQVNREWLHEICFVLCVD